MQRNVFISYSHKDKCFLEELTVFLQPLRYRVNLDVWADTKIKAGQHWRKEIENALSQAIIGILLISPDFLASEFIEKYELPILLGKAEKDHCIILPIIISTSLYDKLGLSRFQAVNDPEIPLDKVDKSERGQTWLKIADRIIELTESSDIGDSDSDGEEDNSAETALLEAIKSRYPDLSDTDAENIASLLVLELIDGLSTGKEPFFRRINEDGIHEITKFFIPPYEDGNSNAG